MARLGKDSNVISHWHHPIENFQTSTMEFYAAVEQALAPKQIPEYSTSRVDWREGGMLTARREYLRVQRGKLAFDICAAPFGTGFFFSWWLAELPPTHGLLYAVLIFVAGLLMFTVLTQTIGFIGGFVFTIFAFPILLLVAGRLVRDGRFGAEVEDTILATPLFGPLYERLFKPVTYYKMDTAIMFQSMVHSAVLDVIDPLLQKKGVRALSELERKPIMRDLYRR